MSFGDAVGGAEVRHGVHDTFSKLSPKLYVVVVEALSVLHSHQPQIQLNDFLQNWNNRNARHDFLDIR